MALSKNHQNFINEYFLQGMNGTDAYQAVYPKASRESARREASRLLTHVDIQAEISQRLKEKHMSADEVLYRLAEQARGEHSAYLLPNGTVNYGAILENGKGHLVHKVKQTKYGNEIEFYDAQAALVHIGKAHGMFADRVEVSGKVELGHTVDQALKTAWGNGPKEPDANNSDD